MINIHNYEVDSAARTRLADFIKGCVNDERRAEVFGLGDWNVPEEGTTCLTQPAAATLGKTRRTARGDNGPLCCVS